MSSKPLPLTASAVIVCLGLLLPVARAQIDSARDDYNFAAGLYDRGLHERSVSAFRSFVERWPADERVPKARFYLGQALVEVGRDAEALAEFDRYLETGDDSLKREALFRTGEVLSRGRRHGDAMRRFEALSQLGKLGELAEPTLYFWAEAAAAAGEKEQAEKAYARLLKVHADGRYAAYAASALGFLLLERDDVEAAERRFVAAAKGDDADLVREATCMIGECRLRRSDYVGALEILTAVLARGAGGFEAQARLGVARAELGRGRAEAAVAAYRELARRYPDDPRLARSLIRSAATLHENGDSAAGLVLLGLAGHAEGQDAKDLAYWSGILQSESGSLDAGIDSLRAAVEAGGGAKRKFSLGDALSRAGRYEEAVVVFSEVRQEADDATVRDEARFAEAFAAHRLDRHEQAVELLLPLDRDPTGRELRQDAVFALGENLFALKRYDQARACYGRLLDSPRAVEALYKRGWCEYLQKEHDVAAKTFVQLLKRDGADPFAAEATYLLGKCYEALDRPAEARAVFEQLGRSGGTAYTDRARLGAAVAARRGGDAAGAAQTYREIIAAETEPAIRADALFGLGEVLYEAGDHAAAERAYRELLEGHPDDPRRTEARLAHGWALRELGQHDAALAEAVAVTKETQETVLAGNAMHLAGLSERASNREEQAAAWFGRLLERFPDHSRAREALLLQGIALARAGRHEDAERVLRGFVELPAGTEGRTVALYELGFCLEARKALDERDLVFARLVQDDPASELVPDVLFRVAESAYDREDYAQAQGLYERVVAREDVAGLADEAWYKLGWCRRQQAQPLDAALAFAKVGSMSDSPLAAESCYLAAEECEKAGRVADAERLYEAMATRHGDHELAPDAQVRRVLMVAAAGRHDDVVRLAPPVIRDRPDLPRTLQLRSALGDAFFELRQWERARTAYRDVIALSEGPLAARAQYRVGLAHREAGEPERAIDELLRVTILYSHREWRAKATLAAADLLAAGEERSKASKLYRELTEEFPDTDEAKAAARQLAGLAAKKEDV